MLIRTPQQQRQHDRRRRLAFTLMEILIVVAIIVILASLGGYYVIGSFKSAQESQAKLKARTIGKAVDTYFVDHGQYPEGLEILLQKSEIGKGPYLTNRDDLIDPWGAQYQFDPSGQRNAAAGAVVIIPDVFTRVPESGREVGNWSDNKK